MQRIARLVLFVVLVAVGVLTWWQYRVDHVGNLVVSPANFDDYVYYYPTFLYAFREASAGNFPFWNPYQHCGSPFFATAQHLLLYPLNLAFWFFPTATALKLTNQLHLGLAVAFTAILARTIGLSRIAALAAGLVYGFCPGMTQLVYLPHHLYGATWIPLHLALAHTIMTADRPWPWALGLSVAIATQYLGSYPMFCAFSAYAVSAYACYMAFAAWRAGTPSRVIRRRLFAIAGAFVVAGAWAAPQLLPAIELAGQSPRAFDALAIEDADPRSLGMNIGGLVLTTIMPLYNAAFFRPHPHVGIITVLLAALALFHRHRRRVVGFFLLLTILAALLSIGRNTPLFGIYFALPTGTWFRIPDRFFILVSLGLAVLAGIGIDFLARAQPRPSRAAKLCGLVLTAAAAFATLYLWDLTDLSFNIGTTALHPYLLAAYVSGILLWLLIYVSVPPALGAPLLGLIPVALYGSLFFSSLNTAVLPENEPMLHVMSDAVVKFISQRQELARTYIPPPGAVNPGTRSPSKAGMLHHLYVAADRENVFPRRFWKYTELMDVRRYPVSQGEFVVTSKSPNLRLFDLMGIRFVVEHGAGRFLNPRVPRSFHPVYHDLTTTIYENPQAMPRTFLVHKAEPVASEALALQRLRDPTFDLNTSVVLEGDLEDVIAPETLPDQPGWARIRHYSPMEVAIDLQSPAPAYLVLTDQFYPGWQADVDRHATPIYRANSLFRAVRVPAGEHRVTFRFVPRSFYRGVLVAVISLIAVSGIGVWHLRRPAVRGHIGRSPMTSAGTRS